MNVGGFYPPVFPLLLEWMEEVVSVTRSSMRAQTQTGAKGRGDLWSSISPLR